MSGKKYGVRIRVDTAAYHAREEDLEFVCAREAINAYVHTVQQEHGTRYPIGDVRIESVEVVDEPFGTTLNFTFAAPNIVLDKIDTTITSSNPHPHTEPEKETTATERQSRVLELADSLEACITLSLRLASDAGLTENEAENEAVTNTKAWMRKLMRG